MNDGFIALITVLIITAIALMLGVGIGLGSISEARMALQKSQSSKAYYLANLCAEKALMELKKNSNYTGNETINIENGSCTILPVEDNWTIKIRAAASNQIKKIKIIVDQINPKMVIKSWQEVADY